MRRPGSYCPLPQIGSSGILIAAAALSLSCGEGGSPTATPTSPAAPATPPVLTLEIPPLERTEYLVGMVDRLPDAGAVTWTSSNADVLEVLPNGRFLARGPGEAELIASREGQEARVTLSVTSPYERTGAPRLTGLDILGIPFVHDGIDTFEGVLIPYGMYDYESFREVPASLSSADPDVLTVDDDGVIRVTGVGETTITATYQGHSATTPVAVLPWDVIRDAISPGPGQDGCDTIWVTPGVAFPPYLVEGTTVPAPTFETCSDGAIRRVHGVQLASSDPAVIQVEPDGFLTARSPGRARILMSSEQGQEQGGEAETPPITVLPAYDITTQALTERAHQDRPDDFEGPQIHVVYAVPEDAPDRGLDLSGALEESVAAIQDWIRQDIGYELNLDTHGGRPDVTFVRLLTPYSDSFFDIAEGLDLALDLQPDKKYLVFVAAWGAAGIADDSVAAVYLDRYSGLGLVETFPIESVFRITHRETVALHEILHTFGAVAECAPHADASFHVNDTPADLMWPYLSEDGFRIDVGRDDYFDHHGDDCLDTADSPYWRQVTTVTTDSSATPRSEGPPTRTAAVTMEERIRSVLHPDPTLRCGLPH